MNRIRNWWDGLNAQWKATLRTSFQTFVGVIFTGALALLAKTQDWINGGVVDWTQEASNFGRLIATGFVAAISGLVAYFMNRSKA